MSVEAESRRARLKRLPMRLRIAHLAALRRCGRAANDLSLSLPTATRGEGSDLSNGSRRDGRLE